MMGSVEQRWGHESGTRPLVETWYRDHQVELVRLAALALNDRRRGEDVVQDLFARLHVTPPRLDDESKPLPYLRSAVLNNCRSSARSRGRADATERRSALVVPEATPIAVADEAVAIATVRPAVLAAVASLPSRQRDVVILRFWLELSEVEIAESLGISPGTVKSSASRAMAKLSPLLEEVR